MKENLWWIVVAILGLITPVQEYIITCEALIVLNWIASEYLRSVQRRKPKRKKVPAYVQMFFVMVVIVVARVIDNLFLKTYQLSYTLSLGLVFFEMGALYKNISQIIGFDITKYLPKK